MLPNSASTRPDSPALTPAEALARANASSSYEQERLAKAAKSGIGWLTAVGALSVINSLLASTSGGWTFFIGLGVTQVLDVLPALLVKRGLASAATLQTVATLFNLSLAALFIVLGQLAQRRHRWALIVGMVLYGLDGLIFIWAQDWLGLAFHAYALFMMYLGLQAYRKLQALEPGETAHDSL